MTLDKALKARVLVEELELFSRVLEQTNKDIIRCKDGALPYDMSIEIFVDAANDLKYKIKRTRKELEEL